MITMSHDKFLQAAFRVAINKAISLGEKRKLLKKLLNVKTAQELEEYCTLLARKKYMADISGEMTRFETVVSIMTEEMAHRFTAHLTQFCNPETSTTQRGIFL